MNRHQTLDGESAFNVQPLCTEVHAEVRARERESDSIGEKE